MSRKGTMSHPTNECRCRKSNKWDIEEDGDWLLWSCPSCGFNARTSKYSLERNGYQFKWESPLFKNLTRIK